MKKIKEENAGVVVTVKQIHNAFYKEAIMPITETQVEVLKKMGFNLSPPKAYSTLFPLNKVIHLNKILLLCEKYDLVFAETSDYEGVIPQKNLTELEQFLNNHNYVHLHKYAEEAGLLKELFGFGKSGKEKKDYTFIKNREKHLIDYDDEESTIYDWCIVAPKNMVVTKKTKKNRLLLDDPIIIGMIKPHWGCGGIRWWEQNEKWGVIVTAWGEEASDESVVNEKMN